MTREYIVGFKLDQNTDLQSFFKVTVYKNDLV